MSDDDIMKLAYGHAAYLGHGIHFTDQGLLDFCRDLLDASVCAYISPKSVADELLPSVPAYQLELTEFVDRADKLIQS